MRLEGRPGWFKLGIVGIILFLLVYGMALLEGRQGAERGPARKTSYSSGAEGYKALYLWLQEMGIPINRWTSPIVDLPSSASVFILVEPYLGPGTGELEAIKDWTFKGGTLILIVRPPNVFLEKFGLDASTATILSPLKSGQDSGLLFQPGPYTRGVRNIKNRYLPGLISKRADVVFHASTEEGGIIAVAQEGKGRIIAVADPSLLCNTALLNEDNSRLALNLVLTHRGEGTVFVDEYHHGYGRATSVLDHFKNSSAFEPVLQVVLLLLVLWAAKGRRFGPPRPTVKDELRSSMQYVKAVAQLFQKAKARTLALSSVIRWTEDEAKKNLVDMDDAFKKTLSGVRSRCNDKDMTDRELLELARRLYDALESARSGAYNGS